MSAFVFLRNLRQLEIAGDFGFIVVLIMVIVIVVSSTARLSPSTVGDNRVALTFFSWHQSYWGYSNSLACLYTR